MFEFVQVEKVAIVVVAKEGYCNRCQDTAEMCSQCGYCSKGCCTC
jgi:hypothetical protein